MLIKTIPVGQLETNCYVVTDEKSLDCAVIDPGDESNAILDYLEDNHLRCRAIFLTHGHFDHVGAAEAVAEETGAMIYLNRLDDARERKDPHFPFQLPAGGEYYGEGDSVELGNYLTVHHENGVLTLYGHLSRVTVTSGDKVSRGDKLGEAGHTGNATGTHLHFELRDGEVYLNPEYYLS